MVSKERNDLRDRLKEFEIIADDLANLKRLQQENEQLKRSLAAQGQAIPASAAPVEDKQLDQAEVSDLFEDLGQSAPQSEDNAALEEFLSSPTDSSEEAPVEQLTEEDPMLAAAAEMPAPEVNEKPKSEKTPEDLLSEFEKMLG